MANRKIGQWEGRKLRWRRWFAWHPVFLGKTGRVAWLRFVRRRVVTTKTADWPGVWYNTWRWEYRL